MARTLIRSTPNRCFARKVYHIKTNDITKMTKNEIDGLNCGDVVVKVTEADGHVYNHAYMVSYKENKVGICLTYSAAGYLETVSYDYTDGNWVYNSTDVWQAQ